MHWLTILGIILIAIGTLFTYLGQDINNRIHQSKLVKQNRELSNKIDKYQKDLSEKDNKIQELQKRVNVINSLDIIIFLDEITPNKPITKKETSAGIQSAIALFSKDETRFRFVTDFQFSFQQISANIRRATFIYKPEEPTQILGRSIEFLEQMEKFVFNYVNFIDPIGFDRNNQIHKVNIKLLLNGIEVVSLENIPIEQGQLYSGQLVIDVNESFKDTSEIYQRQINLKSN